jgi:hypothetical protein
MNTLYGEVRPGGHFRFVNFGHPPPLVFSAEYRKFAKIDEDRMVQFLALGLQIPADHPDRRKYYSMNFRQREFNSSDIAEITLMSPGDILVLYTDGVYDGSDEQMCEHLKRYCGNTTGNQAETSAMHCWNTRLSKTTFCDRMATKP